MLADNLKSSIERLPALHFLLPEQPLASALITFSKQSGLQLIVVSSFASEQNIAHIEGNYSPLTLLRRMLDGTGLDFEISGEQTIIVRPEKKPSVKITDSIVEEVLVTARRRSQRPEDLSVALTVFDSSSITAMGFIRPESLATQVPSMTVKSPFATSNPVFSIRGVGYTSFTSNMSSAIGFYVDDFYLNSSSLLSFDLFDIERVEVLRGPQGSLFGRNTVGGAISVATRRPRQSFDAYLHLDTGDYQYSSMLGAIGGGLTETLAGRLAFSSRRQRDGFYHNDFSNKNHGELAVDSWRGSLQWSPSEALTAYLKLYALRDRSDQWHYETYGTRDPAQPTQHPVVGEIFQQPCEAWLKDDFELLKRTCVNLKGYQDQDNDVYRGQFNLDPELKSDAKGGVLHVNWRLPSAELQLVSGYQRFQKTLQEEFDGSPFQLGDNTFYDDIYSFSQELRLVSMNDESFRWIIGAIYSDESVDTSVVTGGKERWGTDLLVDYRQDTVNQAIFAHIEWALSSRWRLLSGARYSYDKIQFDGVTENLDPYDNGTVEVLGVEVAPGVITVADDNIGYGAWSGKLGIDYQWREGGLTYAHISRAYKSGGFTGYWAIVPEDSAPYEEEVLTAYEVGMKVEWPAHKLTASSALYYYDYRNLQQLASTSTGTFLIGNVGDITSTGLELELRWQPSQAAKFVMGLSYIDAEYHDRQLGDTGNLSGNVPVNTPEWMMNGSIDYKWSLLGLRDLSVVFDFTYQDKVYMSIVNRESESQRAYWLYNVNASLAMPGGAWEMSVWGRNLSNETYFLEGFSSESSGTLMRAVGAPRTLGMSVKFSWL